MSLPNVEKIISYIYPVAKVPVTVDGKHVGDPPKSIKINYSFFYTDGCISCGRCCNRYSDCVYTEHEYQKIQNISDDYIASYMGEGLPVEGIQSLRNRIECVTHDINGNQINLYHFNAKSIDMYIRVLDEVKPRCEFQFDSGSAYYCAIHPVRSITCRMPHVRMFHPSRGHSTSIGISQYGRNWALGCPINLTPPSDYLEFNHNKDDRLEKLCYLRLIADDLKIDTYLPEIIEYVDKITFDNHEQYLGKDILSPEITGLKTIKLFDIQSMV